MILLILRLEASSPDWQILEPCRFREDLPYDADSFYLQLPDEKVLHFRLYEVDAPETSNRLPKRVLEQSFYFKLTPEQTIEKGKEARDFVASCLRDRPLDVRTVWRRILSPDSAPRYAAQVEIESCDLGELLLERGFARPHGYKSPQHTTTYLLGKRLGLD